MDEIMRSPESGDTLCLHPSIVLPTDRFLPAPPIGDFNPVLPRAWESNYMERWLAAVNDPKREEGEEVDDVDDFAVILRHTDRFSATVDWYLIGFTEIGTRAAGEYLAKHWSDLYRDNGCKDFLLLIHGYSNPSRLGKWNPVLTINEAYLREKHLA
jgi:hypothetical protein